jgi:hypothetical protein
MGTTLTTTTIITDFEIWSTLLNSINEYTDTYTDAKETKRHQRVYKAEDLVVLVQIQIDIFMFSVSFVIVMFYCFFKERGGFYGRRRVGNDFGFNTGWGSVFAFVIYSFIEEILKPDPGRKPRKSSASADTDPDEPEQKMDYSGDNSGHSTLPTSN